MNHEDNGEQQRLTLYTNKTHSISIHFFLLSKSSIQGTRISSHLQKDIKMKCFNSDNRRPVKMVSERRAVPGIKYD